MNAACSGYNLDPLKNVQFQVVEKYTKGLKKE